MPASCPDCFKGHQHTHAATHGAFSTLHGIKTYTAGANTTYTPAPPKPKATIIYLPDGFGPELINNRLLADRLHTQTGARVLLPDIIPGGSLDIRVLNWSDALFRPIAWYNVLGWLGKFWAGLRLALTVGAFSKRCQPEKAHEPLTRFARAVKGELGVGAKLGVAGYCWGGVAGAKLCSEGEAEAETQTGTQIQTQKGAGKALVDVHFAAHPSFERPDEQLVEALGHGVPFCAALAKEDMFLSEKKAIEAEAVARRKLGDIVFEYTVYDGVSHGFAVRADPNGNNDKNTRAMEGAAELAVAWFDKYLS